MTVDDAAATGGRAVRGRLRGGDQEWILLPGDRGIYLNGVRTARVRVGERTVVRLGAIDDGADLERPRVTAVALYLPGDASRRLRDHDGWDTAAVPGVPLMGERANNADR